MIIEELWDCFCSDSYGSNGSVVSADLEKEPATHFCPAVLTVDEEICRLASKLGGISSGQVIQMTLKELLEIIPHNRKRSDSYASLAKKLRADYGVDLKIVSPKTQNNHD